MLKEQPVDVIADLLRNRNCISARNVSELQRRCLPNKLTDDTSAINYEESPKRRCFRVDPVS